jgi:hypothetical protein
MSNQLGKSELFLSTRSYLIRLAELNLESRFHHLQILQELFDALLKGCSQRTWIKKPTRKEMKEPHKKYSKYLHTPTCNHQISQMPPSRQQGHPPSSAPTHRFEHGGPLQMFSVPGALIQAQLICKPVLPLANSLQRPISSRIHPSQRSWIGLEKRPLHRREEK